MGNSVSSFNYEEQLKNSSIPARSIQVEGPDEDKSLGFGPIIRNPNVPDGPEEGFLFDEATGERRYSIFDVFLRGLNKSGRDAKFLGTRAYKVDDSKTQRTDQELAQLPRNYKPSGYVENEDGTIKRHDYVWNTYGEIEDAAYAFGRGVAALGCKSQQNIGIFSINRAEWIISSYGFYTQNMRTVSLYATLGPESIEYIINHAQTPLVVVSKENFPSLARVFPKVKDVVKHIVLMDCLFDGLYGNTLDTVPAEFTKQCEEHGITLLGMTDVLKLGKSDEHKNKPIITPDKDDLAFIMYTSGTTGLPKGVMLSHGNITSAVGCIRHLIKAEVYTYFSYLPLSHIFETVAQAYVWSEGGNVTFSQGDVRRLVDDLQASKPSFLPGVPRVFNKFYQSIWAQVGKRGCLARMFIYYAYNYQAWLLRQGKPLDPYYDSKVFAVMREKIGIQNVKVLITGASAIGSYLVEFMRILSNAYFAQGYGLSESSAASAVSETDDSTIGSVGGPLGGADLRLANVEDMGYLYTNDPPTGEVLLSGPAIFKGYLHDEKNTSETLVPDSKGRLWLRTGDVGRINPNGTLSIIDRKKNLLKLSQGEYVSLEKIEDVYGKSGLIGQVWCYGNSYKQFMVGVVVPNPEPFYDFAVSKGWWGISEKLVPGKLSPAVIAECVRISQDHNAEVKKWVHESMKQLEVENKLNGFEKVKEFIIDCRYDPIGQVFTEELDLLTPTMKKKRKPLTDYYLDDIKQMYTKLNDPPRDGEIW